MCVCAQAFQVVLVVKNLAANEGGVKNAGLIPGLGRSPGAGHGLPPTPGFLPGESHGPRSLVSYSSYGHKDWSD